MQCNREFTLSTPQFPTPMAAPVKIFPADSIEARAYAAVAEIPAVESNDSNRLGYHVYLYLTKQYDSIGEAIHVAQARLLVSNDEAEKRIDDYLRLEGPAEE